LLVPVTSTATDASHRAATADPAAAAVLRLVADPVRARIVELLAAEQLCTCHLQAVLDAKQTLVSHHLRVLREAGLVEAAPCGRFTYYRLRPGAFDGAADLLSALAIASRAEPPRRPC
jgi:ArsR family transcriptional regulator